MFPKLGASAKFPLKKLIGNCLMQFGESPPQSVVKRISVDSVLYLHHLRFDSQTLNLLLCRQILLDSEAFVFTESLLMYRKKPT